ncbi:hypothetical protein SAMN05192534_10992 [Alteribacillus persepolensis]|uniref:Bacterial Ig-like domain-containing protein n=1 Tax=Alteribacillus persepolensis TaxID=568899 RepID=A0A1G8EH44_9BACI|nr:immunoglobulin-like domain-containing protein [Alteribacillus persepolensis]SDH69110.1 hypothetical protein SAMN05192534_10992 [Alteribacillus persepolensis]
MWKRTIPVLFSILLFTAFAANAAGGVSQDVPSTSKDDISWETNKETYTADEVISLSLKNNTSNAISFGTPYAIEVFKDGKWMRTSLTDDLMFTQQTITLSPGETYKTTVDLNLFKEKIKPGFYKIVKQVNSHGKPYKAGAAFQVVE